MSKMYDTIVEYMEEEYTNEPWSDNGRIFKIEDTVQIKDRLLSSQGIYRNPKRKIREVSEDGRWIDVSVVGRRRWSRSCNYRLVREGGWDE